MKLRSLFPLILCVNIVSPCISQHWQTLSEGVNGSVSHLVVDSANGYLYASGAFSQAGGIDCNCIARWDGTQWDSLGSGKMDCGSTPVPRIAFFQNQLYARSGFTQGNDLARWNGSFWEYISKGSSIRGFKNDDDTLYIYGMFDSIGGIYSPRIVKFDGQQFHQANSEWPFTTYGMGDVQVYKGKLYAGGTFYGDQSDHLAVWDSTRWTDVGGANFSGQFHGVGELIIYKDQLIVGGVFSTAQGSPGNSIAAWDGENWHNMGGGLGGLSNPQVRKLLVHEGKLYVVGIFRSAGDIPVRSIAIWDGEKWCRVEGEIESIVSSLAFFDDQLIIGGSVFGNIGENGEFIRYIAQLDDYKNYTDSCGWPTGLEDREAFNDKLALYPNPITDRLTVQLPSSAQKSVTLNIYAVDGRCVIHTLVDSNQLNVQLGLSALPEGLYVLTVRTDHETFSTKFVKQGQ